jgi:hypothetical protein
LFRTAAGKTGALTDNAMWQQDAYRMIQRRAADAGIKTRIGNHTFRATILLPFEIEPPIVQGRRDLRGGKWQRSNDRKKCRVGRPSVARPW